MMPDKTTQPRCQSKGKYSQNQICTNSACGHLLLLLLLDGIEVVSCLSRPLVDKKAYLTSYPYFVSSGTSPVLVMHHSCRQSEPAALDRLQNKGHPELPCSLLPQRNS